MYLDSWYFTNEFLFPELKIQKMAGKLSRIQKESGTMRKKITRGTPLILHHLKFSKKENENHQFLLCQKENKERKKNNPPSYIEHKKQRRQKSSQKLLLPYIIDRLPIEFFGRKNQITKKILNQSNFLIDCTIFSFHTHITVFGLLLF